MQQKTYMGQRLWFGRHTWVAIPQAKSLKRSNAEWASLSHGSSIAGLFSSPHCDCLLTKAGTGLWWFSYVSLAVPLQTGRVLNARAVAPVSPLALFQTQGSSSRQLKLVNARPCARCDQPIVGSRFLAVYQKVPGIRPPTFPVILVARSPLENTWPKRSGSLRTSRSIEVFNPIALHLYSWVVSSVSREEEMPIKNLDRTCHGYPPCSPILLFSESLPDRFLVD
ncbi:hypothetical protein LIA77_01168 [Sarocladium implicatum]|nr:hypothetical protein LIA77_01168 [Sarocladium implicatum]